MAVAVFVHWSGVTQDQYDKASKVADWEGNTPDGGLFHVSSFDERGAHIFDLWESAEHFQRFIAERIAPNAQQIGLEGQPEIEIRPAYSMFNPGIDRR
jgi:hypothetical protein